MKTIILLLFFFLPDFSLSQCLYSYTFQGPPGDIKIDSVGVIPNDVYRFDFSTVNVPDKLTIYNLNDSLEFTIGDFITQTNFNLNLYRGYCEFEYDKVLIPKVIQRDTAPQDFSAINVIKERGGMMRLYYTVGAKMCTLKFKVSGNLEYQTVYDLCITKVEHGFIEVSDTIYKTSCGAKAPTYLYENCDKFLVVYEDLSVKDTPVITYNGCVDGEISVSFKNYPQFNASNLKLGFNRITVSNGVCTKDFDFYFSPSTLCEYYIPNVINSSSNNNNIFMLYTKKDVQYELCIFDRWGGMVWEGICISNMSGWKGVQYGTEKSVGQGVYTYVIHCLDKTLYGDITVLK